MTQESALPEKTGAVFTVRGPVPPDKIGFCQSHEHVSVESDHLRAIAPELVIDDSSRTMIDLCAYKDAGGRSIVDAQPVGAGRNALTLQKLSEDADVHIIASTGFHRPAFYPSGHWIFTAEEDRLASLFSEELLSGMYLDGDEGFPARRSEIRAGQVKAALEPGPLDGRQSILFRAAARAAKAADVPLMAHIERGADPIMLADFLVHCGLPPERIIFCHMDRSVMDDPNLSVHKAICAYGIALEYDTIARPKYHSDEHEASLFQRITSEGFGDRLLAGLDVTRMRLSGYGGTPGLAFLIKTFLPTLRAAGICEAAIKQIFIENPARIFQSQRLK